MKTTISVLLLGSLVAAAPMAGTDSHREGTGGPLPLAAPQQIYVMTDKPLYRPGETIWFRAWEVDSALAGAPGEHGVTVQLVDPRGSVSVEKRVKAAAGSLNNDLALAKDLVGGRYLLRVRSDGGAAEDHPLTISTYEIPRLKQSLELERRGYAAGDEVHATLTVLRATGEPARGARVTGTAVVDGVEVARPTAIVGKSGKVTLRFRLPSSISRGDGLLTAVVTDGGASESIQRRIPIETGKVAVAFYPEGGDLVADLASRVYFAASSSLGDPVDVTGRIVDDTGATVVKLGPTTRGKGTFALTPVAGRRYQAILEKPSATTIALPETHADGCVLSVPNAASTRDADLDVTVACTADRAIEVAVALRGREVNRTKGKAGRAATQLRLPVAAGQGAFRVTLFAAGTPTAERLVYRKLGSDLRVSLTPARTEVSPRESVAVTIETKDAAGRPVASDVAFAVVDDRVLSLADDHGARILARLYLEPEMPGQTIDDPNFYFSADPKAPAALDLVLGTQGWRRFKRVP